MVNESEKEQYRQIVRRVLKLMGYDKPTYGDFRLWDGLIDWRATAELLDKPPINTALCHTLDKCGKVVESKGKPVVVAMDVMAKTEEEAAKILSKSSHVFLSWWPSDSFPKTYNKQCEVGKKVENRKITSKDYRNRTFAATRAFFNRKKPRKKELKHKLLF